MRARTPRHPSLQTGTLDPWHTPDGVKIWAASKLRQPDGEIDERGGPLRVVFLGDYEQVACQLEEAVALLKSVKKAGTGASRELIRSIEHILIAVA
jgi:hypothetical protein